MRITVHRGINRIGGCITEIATAEARVFVDLGENLPGSSSETEEEKESFVKSLFARERRSHEAVIYSHGHGDHVGLLPLVPLHVNQYMSNGTRKLLMDRYERLAALDAEKYGQWLYPLKKSKPLLRVFKVGDIEIRPIKVSHSAYDSRMFLITADGERVLHTGDFRAHGYIGVNFLQRLPENVGPVDYLIIEGTMLHRGAAAAERTVADRIQEVIERHKHVLVLTSAMSHERIMSVCHANIRSRCRKPVVTCLRHWAKAMETYGADNPNFRGIYKNYLNYFNGRNPKLDKWIDEAGMVLLAGVGQERAIQRALEQFGKDDFALVYSVWKGYLEPAHRIVSPAYGRIHDMFAADHIEYIHTSGHADCAALQEMIKLANPAKAVIGIHKEANASLLELELPNGLKAKVIPDCLNLENVVIE